MDLSEMNRKQRGAYGESAAARYLESKGFRIRDRNVTRKTGEIDLIAQKGKTLHFVEVKSILCEEFPDPKAWKDRYDPSLNLHREKIRKVARTGEWYAANKRWEGLVAVDAVLVWLRARDGAARVSYLPQIL
ncbi:MAG: YraN family protein [Patescibacteria group bacterium]